MSPKHEYQFRGFFIPWHIVQMVDEGQVTHKEAWLLATIDSLSKGDDGCFASNEWLAKRMKMTIRSMQRSLSKLRKLKLIKQTGFDGRKRILTSDTTKMSCLKRQKRHVRDDENVTHSNKGIDKPSTCSNEHLVASRQPTVKKRKSSNKNGSDLTSKWSKKLHASLQRSNRLMRRVNPSKWKSQFHLLTTRDQVSPKLVTKVLDWYCNNLGAEYVPDARSATSFRDKFERIHAAMQRDDGEDAGDQYESQRAAREIAELRRMNATDEGA